MSRFDRNVSGLEALKALPEGHWWRDLLALWSPPGQPSGPHGLRLAIRNNYLNFYRKGQSVARVSFDRAGKPVAKIHIKYADPASMALGQEYVVVRDREILRRGQPWLPYEGRQTAFGWISAVEGEGQSVRHIGVEKTFVDQLVGTNGDIIDLEMGLPAFDGRSSSPRMDMVAFERQGEAIAIVLWEVKLDGDSRVRCRPGRSPEVLAQLQAYEDFLRNPQRRQDVVAGYARAARLFGELDAMAGRLAGDFESGALLRAVAAGAPLVVDPVPRLVILEQPADRPASQAAWAFHRDRLIGKVPLCLLGAPAPLRVTH